ncbi:MAG: PRC-barrel domain-containing protein [Acetobacteraceae bacterium]
MPEGAKGRWQALRRQSAALSVVMALGYGGNALAQTPNSQPAKPVPSHEKKPVRPKVEKVEKTRAEGLLGQPVLDAKRQSIGHVVNVLIATDGDPRAAVIEFAGFLGVGDRKVAVAWKALHFGLDGDRIVISVSLDVKALRAMPEYDANAKSVPVAAPAHAPLRPEKTE